MSRVLRACCAVIAATGAHSVVGLGGVGSTNGAQGSSGLLAPLAARPSAQTRGLVTHNGIEMQVKSAIAVWDAKESELLFYLLPFEPTAAEVIRLRQGETFWMMDQKPPVDPKKWPTWVPHAHFYFDWKSPAAVGDPSIAWFGGYVQGIARKEDSVVTFKFTPASISGEPHFLGTLTGAPKEGELVTLVAKDQWASGTEKLSWDFTAVAKVVPSGAQGARFGPVDQRSSSAIAAARGADRHQPPRRP